MANKLRNTISNDIKAKIKKGETIKTEKKNKELISMILELQKKHDVLLGVSKEPYQQQKIIPKVGSKKSEATAVLLGGDWHVEEIVDPKTVNYLNEYNPEIAKKRAENFFKNGLTLTNIMAKDIKISDIVIGILGDLMSGYIHPELVENNAMSPTETVLTVRQIICDGINMILESSKYNIVMVMKFGNHGRTTDKSRVSTGYKNSFEWMLYHIIAKEFKNNPGVKFIIEEGYHTYLQIYDQVLRFHHGDAIKYAGGVGGITVPANKAISQWDKAKHADIDCFGHFHQLINMKKFVCNGSNIGYNAYANRIKADYEEPQQGFFLIDKDHGKTVFCPIFVT